MGKPGELTDDLRTALGMPLGNNAHKVPPPWLIAMQRYGPPPSYPNLKIPGLNAPIPDGCSFGYHAGGWGKPPVDEATGLQTPVVEAGLATPSGTASSVQGLETPESLELRKRRIEADMEGGETPSLPYQIIPEKQGGRIGAAMM